MNYISKALVILCFSTSSLVSQAQTAAQIGQQKRVGIIAGDVKGAYTKLAQDLAEVSNESNPPEEPENQEDPYLPTIARVMVTLGGGSIQNIVDLIDVTGIDMAIVQSDVLEAMRIEAIDVPNYRDYIRYVVKLHNEEIHILAGPDIKNIKQLQGKKVSFGAIGSGTSITAPVVFNALDIEVKSTYHSNTEAVAGVRNGSLAAAVFVVGKPADYFDGISLDEGLHILPIENNKNTNKAGYIGKHFTPNDYPNLIRNGRVETIAVAAVLAVYDWDENNSRHSRVALVIERLFNELPRLQQGNTYHPKWKDVDLTAEVPGWDRNITAEQQLKKRH